MALLKVSLPELDGLPLERRKSIIESFNTLPETAALRDRLGKLPFRLGALLMMLVLGVMVFVYEMSLWPCLLAGFLCFLVGVPIGLLVQLTLLRRSLRSYVRKHSNS